MTDQSLDDRMLSAILDGDERAFRVLSHAARYHAARMAHPAGKAQVTEPLIPEDMWEKATYIPMVAPPLPNWSGLGRFITAYVAVLLILSGFLLGVTVRPWVAIPLVWVGCLLGVRLATVHYRNQEK